MFRLRTVMLISTLALTGGVTAAVAQEAPAQDVDDPTMNPYPVEPAPPPPPAPAPVEVDVHTAPADDTAPTVNVETNVPPPVVVQPAPVAEPAPAPVVTQPVVVEEHPVNVYVTEQRPRRNMTISLGGGVSDFAEGELRSRTGLNAAYEARLAIGTGSIFGVEAAYVGTAGALQTLGVDDNAMLISNGAEGLARLNLGTFDVQPYLVGGASWLRYNVVNSSFNTSDVRDSDDVFAIPFGGGISTYLGDSGLVLDGRFTYRATFDDELIRPTPGNSDGSSLSNWMATVKLGYAF